VNYYNENDKHAAHWLRCLIKAELIPPGDVDERSICEVQPGDLVRYTQCHFFAGIAGWSYALRLAGWPDDVPVWTGSCPCQPFSNAGRRKGTADSRHLWPELFRLIAACQPAACFGEQVASNDGREWLAGVRADLEGVGYEVGAADLCAASVGAPHIRQRLYWVADAQLWTTERQRFDVDAQAGGAEEEARQRKRIRADTGAGCTVSGLADTNGRHASEEREQRGGKQRQQPEDGCVSWLGDSKLSRLQGHAGNGDNRHQPGRINAVAAGSVTQASSLGHWSDYDILYCLDGKARRIEPGTFPLVDGVPGRVAQLRGLGNAVVPAVAAKFIESFMEVCSGVWCERERGIECQ